MTDKLEVTQADYKSADLLLAAILGKGWIMAYEPTAQAFAAHRIAHQPKPEYGRVHTDGSRSGGQPPSADLVEDDLAGLVERYRDTMGLTREGAIRRIGVLLNTLEAQARENADLRNDLDAHRNQSAMREASKAQSEAWLEETRAERDAALEEVARSEKHRNDARSLTERKAAANAKIAALTAAGEKVNGCAGHDDGCQIMINGVWSDPIPCTCGYRDALTEWKAATSPSLNMAASTPMEAAVVDCHLLSPERKWKWSWGLIQIVNPSYPQPRRRVFRFAWTYGWMLVLVIPSRLIVLNAQIALPRKPLNWRRRWTAI